MPSQPISEVERAQRSLRRGRGRALNTPPAALNSLDPTPPSSTVGFRNKFSNFSAPPRPASWEVNLAEDVSKYVNNPLGFAQYIFPWGVGDFNDAGGLYAWQTEMLGIIGAHLQSPETHHTPLRLAVASGKGIGKSALISMINWWALSTCEDARVTVTANTEPQLRTKTLPEMNKWARNAINAHWFTLGATSMTSRDVYPQAHDRTWRSDAIAWNEQNPQAFAGLHNKGKRIVLIFDEASEIADVIWDQAEGALTDENTEIIWIAFGNPTRNTGRFRECFGKFKHRWVTRQIDSRAVPGTNKAQIQQWVEDYGEDSDFVRIWVKGEFPRAGSNQLIPSDLVEVARRYKAVGNEELPKVMAVDVARYGRNKTVIGVRQGRQFRILAQYRGLDTAQTAEKVINLMSDEAPDALVVDGDGLGAGVVDHIKYRGFDRKLFEFHGGLKAEDADAYFNRRTEVWGLMRDWLKEGAEIPNDPELVAELTGPQYGYSGRGQQIQLEKKEDMEKRGLASPDAGDCLAMTFSVKVQATHVRREMKLTYPNQNAQRWMQ